MCVIMRHLCQESVAAKNGDRPLLAIQAFGSAKHMGDRHLLALHVCGERGAPKMPAEMTYRGCGCIRNTC